MIGYDTIGSFPALCKRHYHNLLSYKTKQIIGYYFWNDILISIHEKSARPLFEKVRSRDHNRKSAMMHFAVFLLFGILVFCPETGEI